MPTPYDRAWQRLRLTILERDGWICTVRRPGCTIRATQVDHRIPVRIAPELRLDPANLRAVCLHCNVSLTHPRRRVRTHNARRNQASRDW